MLPLALLVAAHPATHVAVAAAASMSWLTVVYTVTAILAAIGVVAAGVVKVVWPAVRFGIRFAKDWDGESERDGVPAKPGVMRRLQVLEFDVTSIKSEVHPNHGKSMKDVVNQTARDITALHGRVDAIDTQRETEREDRASLDLGAHDG